MFYILFRLQVLFNLLIFKSYYRSFTKAFQGYLFIIKNSIIVCIWGVSCEFFCCVFHACPLEVKPYGVPGGGYSTKFYTGRLRLEVHPVTLLYTIFNWKGTLFVYLLYEWYPFNIPIVELCIFYTAVNAPSKYQETTTPVRFFDFFHNHKMHLLTPLGLFADWNDRFPSPFIYFNWWNSYPFIYLKPEKGTPNLIPRVLSHPSKGRRETWERGWGSRKP